jgi:preprotein translocase subunit SecA
VHGGRLARAVRYAPARLAGLAGRVALAQAQRRAGRLHARIRRDLLKMDDQLDTLLAFSGRPD